MFGLVDNKSSKGANDGMLIKILDYPIIVEIQGGENNILNLTQSESSLTYQIFLTAPPTSDVSITINPPAGVSVSPTTLTFTPDNWDIPQTVTVTVTVTDPNLLGSGQTLFISHTAESEDVEYNGINILNMTLFFELPVTGQNIAPVILIMLIGMILIFTKKFLFWVHS